MITRTFNINRVDCCIFSSTDNKAEVDRLYNLLQSADETADCTSPFREQADEVIRRCAQDSVILRPYARVRTPVAQAILWRQSRPWTEIAKRIEKLQRDGAPYLADVLHSVGPQHGRWATNAVPGYSWHQWGEAIDCFVESKTHTALWAAHNEGYRTYADHAQSLGLTAGYYWKYRDAVHIQGRNVSVRSVYPLEEIDRVMALRFGDSRV